MLGKKKSNVNAVKNMFNAYIPEKNIENINLIQSTSDYEKEVGYMLIQIEEIDNYKEIIEKNIVFLKRDDVIIEYIDSVLIKAVIGALPFDKYQNIKEYVGKIIEEYIELKIPYFSCLYGVAKCKIGSIGSENRMCFNVNIPKYKDKLQKLFLMGKGEIEPV